MRYSTRMFVLLVCLFGSVQSVLPDEDKFEGTYRGEGANCDGLLAQVEVDSNTVLESEEGVVTAVAEAVAQAITEVESDPTTATVVAAADAAAEKVLEVVARAVATVSAKINSPNPGCWAIAFGKAQAVAIAQATVTAIAQAFADAEAAGQFANVAGEVSTIETDVEVAVEEIALLLADGSGAGEQSDTAKVEAVARATAVNCAFAQAFAAVVEGVAEAEVLAQAGCLEPPAAAQAAFDFEGRLSALDGCGCANSNSEGAPNMCGLWGDGDYICYVNDLSTCACAQPSSVYSNIGWRYCGPTMNELQQWLSFEDENNAIITMDSNYGYCGDLNYLDDELPTPTPDPTPIPAPAPNVPTVSDCPRFRCIGDVSSCCSQSGSTCTTPIFGNTYNYLGKCASTGQDVWQRSAITCACS